MGKGLSWDGDSVGLDAELMHGRKGEFLSSGNGAW